MPDPLPPETHFKFSDDLSTIDLETPYCRETNRKLELPSPSFVLNSRSDDLIINPFPLFRRNTMQNIQRLRPPHCVRRQAGFLYCRCRRNRAKNAALLRTAELIKHHQTAILAANAQDMEQAEQKV